MQKIKKLIGIGKEFGAGLGDRKLFLYAAAGAYHIFMSIVPFIILMVSLVQFLPVTPEFILSQLGEVLPEQLMTVMERIVTGIYRGGKTAFTVSIILTAYSASCAMRQIMKGIDAAYNCVDIKQNIIVFYARAVLYMIVFVAILLVSFVIMAYGGELLEHLYRLMPEAGRLLKAAKYLRYLVMLVLLYIVFLLMFRFMPKRKVRIKDQRPGALFSALAWVVFSLVFSFYVGVSDKFGAYGVIGTVMVAMMWIYYSIFFLLIGGWLNSFLEQKRREKDDNPANCVETEQ